MIEPIVETETEGPAMASRRKGRSRIVAQVRARPWLRRTIKIAVVLALLPIVLTILYLPPFVHPISTLMVKDLITFQGYDRRWVPLEDIAPVLAHSVIMSEDGQFCSHRGVDLGELKQVVDDAIAGEQTRGASTITMQTVKNLYLWPRPFETLRKVVELPLAVYFDLVMPKRRIMEIYLNIARVGTQHLRHRGRRAASFWPVGQEPYPAAGGAAGGDAAQSDHTQSRQAGSGAAAARQPYRETRRAVGRLCRLPAVSRPQQKNLRGTGQNGIARVWTRHFLKLSACSVALSRGLLGLFTDYWSTSMAVPKRKTSPSKRGMRRSADALKAPTYVEDKNSGEMRRPHHVDLKTGMYRGRQVLTPKES